MDKKKKDIVEEMQENVENVSVENADMPTPFDPFSIDYDALDEGGRKDAFTKTLEQYKMLIAVLKSFEEHITELEKKAEGKVSEDSYKRLMADYDNYKRRNAGARGEGFRDGQIEIFTSLIEVVDNFERALLMIADDGVKKGVEMIYKQFINQLEKFNVKEIEAYKKPFDPNFMNAVLQGEAGDEFEVDSVMEVLQKGYVYGETVIRHSFVKVAK